MPQRVSQKPVNQFNKGLITEAGELTFPEGASVDELNCTLLRDGSRRRRLGLEYETGYSTTASATLADNGVSSVDLWQNAGGVAGLNFVVVQLGGTIHFYRETTGALSANRKTFTIDLTSYARPSGLGASTTKVHMTSIGGILVVVSSEINSIYVTYDEDLDSITVTEIDFRIRDFEWQGDRTTYTTAGGTSPGVARDYDTKNAGWADEGTGRSATALAYYQSVRSNAYPPLTLPWFSGKNATEQMDVDELEKIGAGTSLQANGRYIYDLYDMDRETAAGLADATLNYTETSRFDTVVSYAGRIFYAGMTNRNTSNIFFSQIVSQEEDIGECLQRNDPTAEDFSDLLDTDGGVITIPDAYNIKQLHVLGTQLIVFAENGVWAIRGVDDVFRATSYSVSKVSTAGLTYEGSFVAQEGGRPYWWSTLGIYTLQVSPEQQTLQAVNISLPTIQSLYDSIDPAKRAEVSAAYDGFNSRVVWFYPSNDETIEYKCSEILYFDEPLTAFYPWRIAEAVSSQYALVPFFIEGAASADVEYTVVDSSGNTVVDSSGNTVVVTRTGRQFLSGSIKVLVRTDDANKVTFAEFTDTAFVDWGSANYTSYAEAGYDFVGDLTTKKNTVYVTSYCKVTEESIVDTGSGFTFTRPSSCKVSTYWDFKTSASQTPQEAYRLKELPTPSGAGSFPYPKTVTTSRLRLRGRGRSLRIRFDSSDGYDFHLLGYDVINAKNAGL